ncbi:MAG: hypothetical protein DMG46_15400 [Acidobacteria bacterium]|nr:MAG: hypothetical protein DMG46_15400 [Acidobacteriota bacterium]
MGLAEKIQKDLVDAMRAKDELRLSVLRGIKAAIKHKEVEKIRALENLPAKKLRSSPSSNPICLQGPARPKWMRQSRKRSPNPARIPLSKWAP